MDPSITNNGLSKLLTVENVIAVCVILVSGSIAYGSLASDVEANKEDIRVWVGETKEISRRQDVKMDALSEDISSIKIKQGEFGTDINGIKSRLDHIIEGVDELRREMRERENK